MVSSHKELGLCLAALARKHVKDRQWCLMYYVGGRTLEVFCKSTDVGQLNSSGDLQNGPDAAKAASRLRIYSSSPEYINICLFQVHDKDYSREGVWMVVDPFLTIWLRTQRPNLSEKKALLTLDKMYFVADGETFNATRQFPFKIYQWSPLLLRTLQFLCASCSRISEEPLKACEKCKSVRYCDRRCQKKHLSQHKVLCLSQSKGGVMVASLADVQRAVKDIISRTGIFVPEGHIIATRYAANALPCLAQRACNLDT
jgi:hypothetical protein